MAAGPAVRIEDIIVPEIFTPYAQTLTEQKSRIISSGIAVRDPSMDSLLEGGGITFNVPSFNDVDDDPDRVSNDSSAPFDVADANVNSAGSGTSPERSPDPHKIDAKTEVAVRCNRNNSWSSTRLTQQLAGVDPMDAIANRVAAYWNRRQQEALVATLNGVISDNVSDEDDITVDISGSSYQSGVTDFSTSAFIDAAQTMGDSQEDLVAMIVHSVVYSRMQKNNLIDFIPDSMGVVNIPTYLGRQVIVDDGMPRNGSVYDTWLFGPGFIRLGMASPPNPTETQSIPGAGNGAGQEVLYNRVQFSMHPTGHAYVGPASQGGPGNSVLDDPASWDRVYRERKQIKFARLVTREA